MYLFIYIYILYFHCLSICLSETNNVKTAEPIDPNSNRKTIINGDFQAENVFNKQSSQNLVHKY